MTVWRLIKKLERAAWARKYSELQDARAELAEVFGPAPASELLEADHRYTTREIDAIAREPRPRLVRCTWCKMMREIPTGTVCSLCLSKVDPKVDLQRSTMPAFSAKVPEPGDSGAFTREHLQAGAEMLDRGPVYGLNPKTWADAIADKVARHTVTTTPAGELPWIAKRYVDGRLVDLREDEPMCEHGVLCAHVSAFKGCSTCGTSSQLMRPKHVRRQSGGSCDCPGEGDGRGCTWSELECRVRSYHNSRLSVRSWFRKMRAEDHERWLRDEPDTQRRSVHDVRTEIDELTAPHYSDTLERAAWRRLFDPFFDGTR